MLLGWLTTIGVAALLTAVASARIHPASIDVYSTGAAAPALPVLIALVIATLIGGHVAGRIAGYRTSWHGLMSGFLGMLAVYGYVLFQIAVQRSVVGLTYYATPELFPSVLTLALYQSYPALVFGLVMGSALQLFASWLGGLLAAPRGAIATIPSERTHPRIVPAESAALLHPSG